MLTEQGCKEAFKGDEIFQLSTASAVTKAYIEYIIHMTVYLQYVHFIGGKPQKVDIVKNNQIKPRHFLLHWAHSISGCAYKYNISSF